MDTPRAAYLSDQVGQFLMRDTRISSMGFPYLDSTFRTVMDLAFKHSEWTGTPQVASFVGIKQTRQGLISGVTDVTHQSEKF